MVSEAQQEHLNNINIEIKGINYNINLRDIKDFMEECNSFMDVDGTEFEIITQSISDTIIDSDNTTIETKQLKTQLRFLREVGFFLKNFVSVNERAEA